MLDLTQVWQKKGAAEEDGVDLNKWERAAVDINIEVRAESQYKLVWEASVGNKSLGNIGLDDMSFTPGCK